jgi:hypothetical protein
MRFFDYMDTIEKPTIDNIRVIYKAINVKYDELIDMAVEPNSKNYNKWMQTLDCLKASEDLIIECIGKNRLPICIINHFIFLHHLSPIYFL